MVYLESLRRSCVQEVGRKNREGTVMVYLESLRLLVLCTGGGEEEGEYAAHRHHARHVVRGLVPLA